MKDPKNWGHMTIPLLRQNDMESGMWCFSLSWRLSMPAFPRKQNSWESILLILIWTIFYLIYRLKFFKMSGEWDTFYEGHVEREWFNPVRASSRSGSSQKKGKGVQDAYFPIVYEHVHIHTCWHVYIVHVLAHVLYTRASHYPQLVLTWQACKSEFFSELGRLWLR